jgi:hypothetical protein
LRGGLASDSIRDGIFASLECVLSLSKRADQCPVRLAGAGSCPLPIHRISCEVAVVSGQGDEMWYRAGADLVVVFHLLFIGFVVGGVFLTWRWPLIICAHIPALLYGALIEFAGFRCPLTLLENDLRERAGDAGYRDGFIAHYLIKVIYPPGLTHGMQIGLGVLLLLVAILGYWGFLRRRAAVRSA